MIFKDRFEAAKLLAKELSGYKNNKDAIILAIPRGGLQTGNMLAKELKLPLDIALSKKIGYPGNEEYAIGAVTLYNEVVDESFEDKKYIESEVKKIRQSLKERYEKYHGKKNPIPIKGKIVILTDDGVATGRTMMALIEALKKEKPKKIIVAVPVGPPDTIDMLKKVADEVICLQTPEPFFAIGQFYANFEQVEDEEAIRLLREVQ